MDYLLIGILLLAIGGSGWYVIRAKKSGKKCIGCPDGGCSGQCSQCAHCQSSHDGR